METIVTDMALSPRQKRVYEFIKGYIASNGEAPKFTEIAIYFHYRSWATVHRILRLLEEEGLIKRNPRLKRGIELVPLRVCPVCGLELLISEFGICRARKDGRNLYCKSCIRAKVNKGRVALRQYKAARKRYVETVEISAIDDFSARLVKRPSSVDRVREAIRNGARTQAEIRSETRLGKDVIGDALANLLLWAHEISTRVIDGTRVYEMNTVEEVSAISYRTALPFDQVVRKANEATATGDRRVRRVA